MARKYSKQTIEAIIAYHEIKRREEAAAAKNLWQPISMVQREAYRSKANELYYGGAAGGGKSYLLLGLAVRAHYNSLILRREYPQLEELMEKAADLLEPTEAKYNQQRKRWVNIPGDRTITFGSVKTENDKKKHMGRPRDFIGFDELPNFTRTMYKFIIGWNRSTDPRVKRVRVVGAGNPPLNADDRWVIDYWAPWLDKGYKGVKAKPGELRWFATIDGEEREVEGGAIFTYKNRPIRPRSRTFLPARVEDNPILFNSDYPDVLNNMPEPLRSLLLFGDYEQIGEIPDHPWQVIPTKWIELAQERYAAVNGTPSRGLTRLSNDTSTVTDRNVIGKLYGDLAQLVIRKGADTPDSFMNVLSLADELGIDRERLPYVDSDKNLRDLPINIDILGSGGEGTAAQLRSYGFQHVYGIHGNAGSGAYDHTGYIEFANLRAEMFWSLRFALDPMGGAWAIPDDPQLKKELQEIRWKPTPHGILIERKDDIMARLDGKSPDLADALAMLALDMQAKNMHEIPASGSYREVLNVQTGQVPTLQTIDHANPSSSLQLPAHHRVPLSTNKWVRGRKS